MGGISIGVSGRIILMTEKQKMVAEEQPVAENLEAVSTDTEAAFFAQTGEEGAALAESAVDEEELWEHQVDVVIAPRWQPVVPLILALASGLLMWFFLDEFRFAVSSSQPQDLGSVVDGCHPTLLKKLQHNRLIKIRGIIPQPNLTAEARVHFRKRFYVVVLGCNMIVSLSQERYQALVGGKRKLSLPKQEIVLPKALQDKIGATKIVVQSPDSMSDTNFVVQGRAVLALRSSTADNLRRFYAATQGGLFSAQTFLVYDEESPQQMWWVWIGYIMLSAFLSYNVWRFLRAARENWWEQD